MIDRRLALLLLGAVALAGYSVWSGDGALMSLVRPVDNEDQLAAAANAEDKSGLGQSGAADLNPLAKLSADQFDEILKRPLFNPSRAPAPPPEPPPEPEQAAAEEAAPAEPPVNPDDFTLLGIAARDGTWTAVMRWNPTNEIFRLKTGGEMQGWKVAAIAAQGVTITKDDQSLDIKMFLQRNTPPPPVPGAGEDEEESQLDEAPGAADAQRAMDAQRAAESKRALAIQQQQQMQQDDQ
jgi:hypothetical protein